MSAHTDNLSSKERFSGCSLARQNSILAMCDAYESGIGHGLKGDRLPNPYEVYSNEWVAYDLGYNAGIARAPSEPTEYPSPVEAFKALSDALPEGFQFQGMEPNTDQLTHQEIFSAVLHHASEIVRLTQCVPAECTPSTKTESQK